MLPSVQTFSGDGVYLVTNSNGVVAAETETNFKFLAEWVVNPDPIASEIYTATERQAAFPRDIVTLVTEYLQNHEALKSLSIFGPADWTTTFNKKVEMIQPPPEMDAFLQRINPFTGKLNAESCLCVFIPSHYQDIPSISNTNEEQELVNHPLIPLTPATMNELAENPSNPENQSKIRWFLDYYYQSFTENDLKEARKELLNLHAKKSYWVVITTEIIPDSLCQSYSKQKDLVDEKGAKEYWQVPSIREAIICAFAHFAKTGVRILWTYTRCVEQINDCQTVVGGFAESGIAVDSNFYAIGNNGVVALRKFAF